MQRPTLVGAWHLTFVKDCILYHYNEVCGHQVKQLCVPRGRRMQVMCLTHDAVVSGHLGKLKTNERIRFNFFSPNMKHDILSYTSSCQPCQLRARTKWTDMVPITHIVRPTVPFVVCHADVIGPIEPSSAKGHKWALCIIDDCTRWPAVYLLRSATAKATCDAFMELFSTSGWTEFLCTDQGTNFCNQLIREFLIVWGFHPGYTHPITRRLRGLLSASISHSKTCYTMPPVTKGDSGIV